MNRSNDEFAKQAGELFDESVEQLDAATLSKLNLGRQAALAELENPRAGWVRWAPAAGVTAAVAIARHDLRAGPRDRRNRACVRD